MNFFHKLPTALLVFSYLGLLTGLPGCSESTLTQSIKSDITENLNDILYHNADIDPLDSGTDSTLLTGEFLDPCDEDLDCESRYCIQYGNEYVCTELCNEDTCPEGWFCATLINSGMDAVRICVPEEESLCKQCDSNDDCGSLTSMCYNLEGMNICGLDCTDDICPGGYYCSGVTDLAGAEGRQCVPYSETCSCLPDEEGQSRPCISANDQGICEGVEICEGDLGWSSCSAPTPVEEICDGLDNNCNGLLDEDLVDQICYSTPNPLGSCEGVDSCQGSSGWICTAPDASIELCDGLDNNCNGIIDDGLCYDGNPCTTDLCDPETDGCTFVNYAGPCSDVDACTTSSMCIEGLCVGSQLDCSDGNLCTDDWCDPVGGCQHTELNGGSCETGNYCTADLCDDGVCVSGPSIDCGGGQCESSGCEPETGCFTDPLSDIACDDDDVCTTDDICSNGSCVGGDPYCEGRPCENCDGEWNLSLGGWCVELFGSPQCLCICL